MAQHTLAVANGSRTSVRTGLQSAVQAVGNLQKGPTAPASPQAGWLWLDDNTPSASVWTLNFYDGSQWIAIGYIDTTNDWFLPILGGTTRLFQSTTDTPGYGGTSTGGSIEKNAQGAALFLSRSAFASLYLNVNGDDQVAAFSRNGTAVGSIAVSSGLTTYNTTSDPALKDRIAPLDGARALALVRKTRIYVHGWKADPGGRLVHGVMAPEFRRLFPWAVTPRRRTRVGGKVVVVPMQVDVSKAVPATMAAVQEIDRTQLMLGRVVERQAAQLAAQAREMQRQQRALGELARVVARLLRGRG